MFQRIASTHINRLILYICCSVIFFCSQTAEAQYGFKIGTTVSNFYFTGNGPTPYDGYDFDLSPFLGYDVKLVQAESQSPVTSYYISVYRSFFLTDKFGLRPELSFTQKGVKFSQSEYEKLTYRVKINYLEIPLSATYKLGKKENAIWEIYTGGYGAVKLNAFKHVSTETSEEYKRTVNSVKLFDGGLHLGVNYKHRLTNDFLVVDFRVFLGLSNIFELPQDWTRIYFETPETKITGLNLSVGYEF